MADRRRLGLVEATYRFGHDYANGNSIISAMARVNGPLNPDVAPGRWD